MGIDDMNPLEAAVKQRVHQSNLTLHTYCQQTSSFSSWATPSSIDFTPPAQPLLKKLPYSALMTCWRPKSLLGISLSAPLDQGPRLAPNPRQRRQSTRPAAAEIFTLHRLSAFIKPACCIRLLHNCGTLQSLRHRVAPGRCICAIAGSHWPPIGRCCLALCSPLRCSCSVLVCLGLSYY